MSDGREREGRPGGDGQRRRAGRQLAEWVSLAVSTALILALWGAATPIRLAVAAWTAVGPVLVVVTRGHGVHAGDLVAFAAAYSTAAVLTRRLLATA